jgi:ribonucleoside-triphosphate reductase
MLKLVPNSQDVNTRQLMSQTKFYEGYSRWSEEQDRYETWEEAVTRVMNMHRETYKDKMSPELSLLIDEAESLYKLQYALGAQRALQFGGEQLKKHQMRMYNCTSSYADRSAFFGELFYILLCGAGAGFSVQNHHVAKLPDVAERKKQAKGYVIEDSIEGWADSLSVLMSSYC